MEIFTHLTFKFKVLFGFSAKFTELRRPQLMFFTPSCKQEGHP